MPKSCSFLEHTDGSRYVDLFRALHLHGIVESKFYCSVQALHSYFLFYFAPLLLLPVSVYFTDFARVTAVRVKPPKRNPWVVNIVKTFLSLKWLNWRQHIVLCSGNIFIHSTVYYLMADWNLVDPKRKQETAWSAVADKPRDAFVQMQWRGWPENALPHVLPYWIWSFCVKGCRQKYGRPPQKRGGELWNSVLLRWEAWLTDGQSDTDDSKDRAYA